MIGGFALVAAPAEYGVAGVKSFIVQPRRRCLRADLAVVSLVLPDQQIWDFSRIIETTAHKPGRNDGHVLAVESRPRANEVLMPPASQITFRESKRPGRIARTLHI
jgi:hypothetical protein